MRPLLAGCHARFTRFEAHCRHDMAGFPAPPTNSSGDGGLCLVAVWLHKPVCSPPWRTARPRVRRAGCVGRFRASGSSHRSIAPLRQPTPTRRFPRPSSPPLSPSTSTGGWVSARPSRRSHKGPRSPPESAELAAPASSGGFGAWCMVSCCGRRCATGHSIFVVGRTRPWRFARPTTCRFHYSNVWGEALSSRRGGRLSCLRR